MTISLARAKEICTKSELEVVQQSSTRNIGKLDSSALKSQIRRARNLRDKWRDQSQAQHRTTKKLSPQEIGEANARSTEKATLFDEALARFEKRLGKLDATSEKSNRPQSSPAKASSKKDHRADRANVRGMLNAKMDTLNAEGSRGTSRKKSGKKNDAPSTQQPAKPKRTTSSKSKLTSKKRSELRANLGLVDASNSQPTLDLAGKSHVTSASSTKSKRRPSADKLRNIKAKTSAKANKVARSGAPRIQAHVSSQGRKNQAKRNSKP